MKLLERKLKDAVKAQNNIVKAIEQGIITEVTKTRLTELEKEVTSLEFEIAKEKARSYTYLTVEQIEMYLSKFVFEDTSDIKVRKLIINTFVREVILYDDEIVITYTFTDDAYRPKRTKETTIRTEKQIELAENSASSYSVSSSIFSHCPPSTRDVLMAHPLCLVGRLTDEYAATCCRRSSIYLGKCFHSTEYFRDANKGRVATRPWL